MGKDSKAIFTLLTCGHVRPKSRTQAFEFAIPTTNGDNQHTVRMIKLELTNRVIVSEPHPPLNLPSPEVDEFRESMKHTSDDSRLL